MEIVYTLNIQIGPEHGLQYVNKDIGEIGEEIKDFLEKFEQGKFSIDVKTEGTIEQGRGARRKKHRKARAAQKQAKSTQTSAKKHGRGRPKGWKKGMSFEEARDREKQQRLLPPEDDEDNG